MRVKHCAESPKYNMSKIESSEMASSLKGLQLDDEKELLEEQLIIEEEDTWDNQSVEEVSCSEKEEERHIESFEGDIELEETQAVNNNVKDMKKVLREIDTNVRCGMRIVKHNRRIMEHVDTAYQQILVELREMQNSQSHRRSSRSHRSSRSLKRSMTREEDYGSPCIPTIHSKVADKACRRCGYLWPCMNDRCVAYKNYMRKKNYYKRM